ncbi:MAG: hypothetical protein ACK5Q1_06190, partial [Limnobacter sp.]
PWQGIALPTELFPHFNNLSSLRERNYSKKIFCVKRFCKIISFIFCLLKTCANPGLLRLPGLFFFLVSSY